MKIKALGWRPSLPDHRDLALKLRVSPVLKDDVDLRTVPNYQPVWDQEELGSCTAHGVSFVDQFVQIKEGKPIKMPSRLQAYYCTRVLEGTVDYDAGASVRDALKAIAKFGLAPALLWPYHIAKFKTQPPQNVMDAAQDRKATQYLALRQTENAMEQCLAEGYPFAFGFTVYQSFENIGNNGIVPMPTKDESMLGGHCVAAVGFVRNSVASRYNLPQGDGGWIIGRNSWGVSWGDRGHFYMPYAYVQDDNLSSDFWTIRACQ
jgi:C1A family cysteine protease